VAHRGNDSEAVFGVQLGPGVLVERDAAGAELGDLRIARRATFHGVSVDPRGCERAVGEHGGDRRTGLWLRRARLAYAAEDALYAPGARGGDDGSGS
jgi:hypothetical protein